MYNGNSITGGTVGGGGLTGGLAATGSPVLHLVALLVGLVTAGYLLLAVRNLLPSRRQA
ncbi:hypothetical protein [Jiangella sp. DSM 45060]|uniref:hypothetical protein n=1 Tax=Jiangella sp. DSM 45060 TaxID=1798224 RepID=UPI00087D663A|nr:hypothetical protein [Jiangella sp. DSM 45060]SDT00798.1 hypothetical protein SAMN04515669_2521 [Jiangella sp. DSM 45060]